MKIYSHDNPPNGFTLLEVLLVVAIITVMAVVSAPVFKSLANNNDLDVGANVLIQDLYRAQSYSRNVAFDTTWGVAVNGQTLTLFRGASYAARNSAFDDNYTLPFSVTLSGSAQIVYSKLTGIPQSTGSFVLATKTKNTTVTVNSKGMVDY